MNTEVSEFKGFHAAVLQAVLWLPEGETKALLGSPMVLGEMSNGAAGEARRIICSWILNQEPLL